MRLVNLLLLLISFHFSSSQESAVYPNRPGSLGVIGDTTDVQVKTRPGTALIGGGGDVDAAFKWMLQRSGGGNVVVIRASGTAAYNPYIWKLSKIASVETLKIDSRELAESDFVVKTIQNAEMLFIAGGDQSVYMNMWKGTKTMDAINYLLNDKKVPVGGTSAGCAVLSGFYYSGEGASAQSKDVLNDPFHKTVTVYNRDFLHPPFLENVITDQHYVARNRQGRHVTFISRVMSDWGETPLGIAADEKTAVCIDEKGKAVVFGVSKAYFIRPISQPQSVVAGKPLHWNNGNKALRVWEVQGSEQGTGVFKMRKMKMKPATNAKYYYWWVENGELKQQLN